MKNNSSQSPAVRNEKLLRRHNTTIMRAFKRYFHNDRAVVRTPIKFACECSDLACDSHIPLSIERYEELHKRKDRFVLSKGHQKPNIEKIISDEGSFLLVEKFALPGK